jgi:hypothetical protein
MRQCGLPGRPVRSAGGNADQKADHRERELIEAKRDMKIEASAVTFVVDSMKPTGQASILP